MASGEMSRAAFTTFLATTFGRMVAVLADGAIAFACMDWRHMQEILTAAENTFSELKNLVVWDKDNGGMGSLYRSKHELIFVFKAGRATNLSNVQLGRHGRNRTNVWSYPGQNTFHRGRDQDLADHPIDPVLVSVISASTALAASITGPLVTLYVARAQIRAAVRSANRQRWIEEFRELIANFCGQIAAATQVREKVFRDGRVSIPIESEILHEFERLISTATKIRLMINPLDREHLKLLEAINDLLTLFRTAAAAQDIQDDARSRAMQIVEMSLTIIRHEWLWVQRGV